MGGASRRSGLYAITSPDPEKRPRRVTFELLEDVVNALHALTGKRYSVGDLIEFTPDAPAEEKQTAEGEAVQVSAAQ